MIALDRKYRLKRIKCTDTAGKVGKTLEFVYVRIGLSIREDIK